MGRHTKDARDAGALSSAHFPEMEAGVRRGGGGQRESRFGEDTNGDSATDLEKMDPEVWDDEKKSAAAESDDPFTGKGENDIEYKTMEWWCVLPEAKNPVWDGVEIGDARADSFVL